MEYVNNIINVAVINFKPESGDKEYNCRKIMEFTEASAKRGADIVLFPEMCLTGYEFYTATDIKREDKVTLAETVPGPSTLRIAEVTKKYGVFAVFGMPYKESESTDVLYNAAAVVGPDGIVGAYRKIHPYGDENTWCVKGDTPFMFETKWGKIAVGVCYDTYHFPELMRYYASKGARLYLNPTAIYKSSDYNSFREGYLKFLESGVLTNHIFIASSNLVGHDRNTFLSGGSVILGPKLAPSRAIYCHCYAGNVDYDHEDVFLATLDLSLASRQIFENNNYTGVPDFRPDLYRNFK